MARRSPTDAEIMAQLPAARRRAANSSRNEPHALAARYDRQDRCLHIELTNGAAFSVPVSMLYHLDGASEKDLADVTISPAGVGLHWERLNADLGVAAIARFALGGRTIMRAAGAIAGASRSAAKRHAARLNGQLGGRPRKRKPSAVP